MTKNYKPEFPISIGIIGSPSSGKSNLIWEYMNISKSWWNEQNQSLVFVENTGSSIEEKYDQAMGINGNYRDSLWAFFERLTELRRLQLVKTSAITSGTVVDNLAHLGITMENLTLGGDSGLVTPQTNQLLQQCQNALVTLTYLYLENFQYTFAFYLPLAEKIIIPGQDESEIRYNKRINDAILSIFQNFQMRIQVLDQPTIEEKAQEIHNVISRIVAEGVELPTPEELEEQAEVEKFSFEDLEVDLEEEVKNQEERPLAPNDVVEQMEKALDDSSE